MALEVVVTQPGRQEVRLALRAPLVIGRDCEGLLLDDPQVSRRHLQLTPIGAEVLCTDLGSTNGTYLDGVRVDGAVRLAAGQTLAAGGARFRLAPPEPRPPIDADNAPGRATTISVGSSQNRATSIELVADLVTSGSWSPHADAGTLTILFSDIESHTEMVSRVGDGAWFERLEFHNQVFRNELRAANGREVKSQGDGFMLTFRSVRQALAFRANGSTRTRRAPG